MPSSLRHPSPLRALAAALAVLLPLLLLVVGLTLLVAPRDEALSEWALELERRLAEGDPQLVLLGNSMVGRGVDAELLSTELGPPAVRVVKAHEAGTRPANWYLVLKNRVYGQGLEPHAIVVGMGPGTLMLTSVETDLGQKSLADHMGPHEPVVNRKVYGRETPNPWLLRLRERRGRFQDAWAGWLRAGSVGLFHGEGEQDLLERGEAVAAPALERIFEADGAVDISLHQRVIPVVEHQEEEQGPAGASAVSASFVPDILDLAAEHGTRVVFVWMPALPATKEAMTLEPAVQAELIRLLNERGAAWVDLSGDDYPAALFDDPVHLSAAGRARFTPELAQALKELDILGEGPFDANRVPLALDFEAALHGEPPDLGPLELSLDPRGEPCMYIAPAVEWAALGGPAMAAAGPAAGVSPLVVLEDGQPLEHVNWPGKLAGPCIGAYVPYPGRIFIAPGPHEEPPFEQRSYRLTAAGEMPVRMLASEAWFVYPGTRLQLDFEGWPGEPGTFELQVGLEPLIGQAAGASVRVDGQDVPLAPQGLRYLAGRAEQATPDGPWSVEIASADDGPWLLLRWLGASADGSSVDLIGSEAFMQPPVVSFMVMPAQSQATVEGAAPSIPLALEQLNPNRAVRTRIGVFDQLSDKAIGERIACGHCSPLRIRENMKLLPAPEWFCGKVVKGDPGLNCQVDGEIFFTSSDGTDPLRNGRHYALTLPDERQHGLFWWLYPGDRARLPLSTVRARQLRDGASRLHLEGIALAGQRQDGLVRIRLLVGDEVALDEQVSVRSFDDGPFDRQLPERYALEGVTTALELESEADAPFLFLTTIELGE